MRRLEWALVVVSLLASGCGGPRIPKGSDAGRPPLPPVRTSATSPATGHVLTLEALQNAAFPLPEAGGNLIRFTEGKYRGAVVLGSIEEIRYVILDRVGRGDLDGDGVEDAALIMVKDPTGEAPVYTLWAVINRNGVPDPRGSVLLGEKLQVGGMNIEALTVYIDVVRPGLEEIQGAPTRRIKESYKLLGDRLERADTFR
jgi:hypothetical protein